MSEPIDPAEVSRQHYPQFFAGTTYRCEACARLVDGEGCMTYLLAEALAAEQAKTARVAELAHRFELVPRARLLGALTARSNP